MNAEAAHDPARDAADDLRRLLVTSGLVLAVFSVGAAAQSVFIHGAALAFDSFIAGVPSFVLRVIVNLLACLAVLALCAGMRFPLLAPTVRVVMAIVVAFGISVVRFALQNAVGIYDHASLETSLAEVLSGAAVILVSLTLGMAQMLAQSRLRAQERAHAEQRLRATTALAALSDEELRVRRTVAEGLHGGLQSRLVMVSVQLDRLAERWRAGTLDETDLGVVERLRAEIDALREEDVRELSHLLYPAGVEIGLAFALRRLARRVPSTIAVESDIDDSVDGEAAGDESAVVAWRVALLRAAEEGITNALRHGAAGRIRIELHMHAEGAGRRVVLVVDDDGSGFVEGTGPRRGLARSSERLESLGGSQRLETSPWGGVRLIAELPVVAEALSGP